VVTATGGEALAPCYQLIIFGEVQISPR